MSINIEDQANKKYNHVNSVWFLYGYEILEWPQHRITAESAAKRSTNLPKVYFLKQ